MMLIDADSATEVHHELKLPPIFPPRWMFSVRFGCVNAAGSDDGHILRAADELAWV